MRGSEHRQPDTGPPDQPTRAGRLTRASATSRGYRAGMVVEVMRTRDGQWTVHLHHDRTADLTNSRRITIMARVSIRAIGEHLAGLGYDPADLVKD